MCGIHLDETGHIRDGMAIDKGIHSRCSSLHSHQSCQDISFSQITSTVIFLMHVVPGQSYCAFPGQSEAGYKQFQKYQLPDEKPV